jgi:uncharacterized protein YndB with AHSA1/START domain
MTESTADAFGTLLDGRTIRFVRDLPGPIERVWAYLTESDLKATWIGSLDVPSTVGGESTTTWEGENGEPGGGLTIRTRAFDPPHVLEYDWIELPAPGGETRSSVVRFELAAHGDGVRLTLTHRALPPDAFTTIGAGWHAHLDTLLAQLTGGGGPDANARYEALAPRYGALATFPTPDSVRIERVFAVPPERVWAYLTEPALLATWLARGTVPARTGERFMLTLTASGDTIDATLIAYDPPRELAYTWFATGYEEPRPEHSHVRFELGPAAEDETALTLTHGGVLPDFLGRVAAGWHSLLDALTASVAGTEPPAPSVYPRVIDAYEDLARAQA